jgi:hypothetical protein
LVFEMHRKARTERSWGSPGEQTNNLGMICETETRETLWSSMMNNDD